MPNKDMYNWKITLKKFLLLFIEVLILGTVSYITENQLWLFLLPILEAIRNWLKHRTR